MAGMVIAGRYRLQAVLGRGGMATVWRAVDDRLGRPIAVKVLSSPAGAADPAAVRRFEQEAHAAARLSHPNIVAVHDVGREQDMAYLVMELVDGASLADQLAHGPLPTGQAAAIAVQVCEALAAAHRAGVIHRDIKPANILLARSGEVKVCDFGIARLTHQQQTGLTATHTVIGTSAFMAPEQATGGPVDARTDLYALGCVLYAMLTGQPPFDGENPMAVLHQHLHEPPVPPRTLRRDVPAGLDRLVTDLLAKHPADRPATADEVRDRLGGAATDRPVQHQQRAHASARVVSPTRAMPVLDEPSAPDAPRRRRPISALLIAAVTAVILAALTIAAVLSSRQANTDAGPATGTPAGSATTPAGPPSSSPSVAISPIAALRAAISQQVGAGQLDTDAAKDLGGKLDDVEKELVRNRTEKAAGKLADLRDKLDELHNDGKVGTVGYQAIRARVDQLADTLPSVKNNKGDKGD
ncbi:protein kinase domain-containing protein [Dactylosporangium salmoneum]|uniref:non-specific serine/threonine protein kinase n=1 Tax=Dactylosporangium salmoneum TaxID=53361 RepID=A0ABN3GRP0_9ACTN